MICALTVRLFKLLWNEWVESVFLAYDMTLVGLTGGSSVI